MYLENSILKFFMVALNLLLVLIFSFFNGLGGMAVVAGVWGFWDIIAGLILAGFWARKPLRSGGPVAENAP